MKTQKIGMIVILAALLMAACGAPMAAATQAPSAPMAGGSAEYQKSVNMPSSVVANDQAQVVNEGLTQSSSAGPAQPRLVIQNADLSIVVKDPRVKMSEIADLAKRLGGFVVSSNMSQSQMSNNAMVPEGSISIRVPAESLDTALVEIKANTIEVQSENRSGEDVTDRYVDLASQLKAKQAAADKLYEILGTTTKAEDTLLVFNQLTQVQSEIEVLKGQINYYEQASALSAVSVRLVAEESIQPIEIAGWRPAGVARDALQSLINFFQGFVEFLIWLVIYILPVGVVVITVLAVLWRLLRWFWVKLFPKKAVAAVVDVQKKAE